MRWLLLKDLQILRRSPFLVGLLIAYPVAISLLVGAAVSGGPSKPKVAVAYLVAPEKDEFSIGGQRLKGTDYVEQLFRSIEPIRVQTREQAIQKVRDGDVTAAFVIPENATDRLQATLQLGGGDPPTVDVYYNAENPAKRRETENAIRSRLADANNALSREITEIAARYLSIITSGGRFSLLGRSFEVLGLRKSQTVLEATIATLPADAPERVALEQVARFAKLAADNLDLSKPILAAISSPVKVNQRVVAGSRSTLEVYFAQVAVTISLMFVTLLLTAGMLALEREENAFSRLMRGLVPPHRLLAEKVLLGAVCGVPLALAMLLILSFFLDIDQGRVLVWIPAALFAAAAFSAMGVAIGAIGRDVRAASLLAFALSVPLAALALVPAGPVVGWLYDAITAISAVFPFKASLSAFDVAVSGGEIRWHLLHLAGLTLAFGLLARLALRRFT